MTVEYGKNFNIQLSETLRMRLNACAERDGIRPAEWFRARLVDAIEAAEALDRKNKAEDLRQARESAKDYSQTSA